MTPDQCLTARELLGWSPQRLAVKTGSTAQTIRRFERGLAPLRWRVAAMQRALEAAGVVFIPENGGGPGVRLRASDGATATPPGFASTMAAALDILSTKAAEDAEVNEGGPEPAGTGDVTLDGGGRP